MRLFQARIRLLGQGVLILWIISFATGAVFASSDQKLSMSIAHYMKALMNDMLGATDEAIDEYQKAAEYDEKSSAIHLRLGADYARMGQFPEAIRELKMVSEFEPENLQARYLLALIYSTQRDFEGAAAEYESILKFLTASDPKNTEVRTYLAQLYYSQGKYDKAIEQFEAVLEAEPDNVDNIYILGSLYIDAEQRPHAIELFKRGLDLDPNHDGILNSLAYVYAEDGKNLDEALRLIERALELEPDNGAYLDTQGWIYYQKGMYIEAIDTLKKADMFLQDPVIYEHLGDVYHKLGQVEETKYYWGQSLKLKPNQDNVREKLDRISDKQALTTSTKNPQNNQH